MLSFNRRTNTLEYRGHGYRLQEPAEPQLYREQFPFSEVPKLSWNHRLHPMSIPADIWVTDSTFVDGQRGRPPYTSDQVLRLFELLVKLGGQNGVVRQAEMPIATAEQRAALERCLERDYRYPEITAKVSGALETFGHARALGLREAGFSAPASDYLIRLRRGVSRKHVVDEVRRQVGAALDEGVVPRVHLEDVTRADVFGFVVPLVKELLLAAEEGKSKVKVRLCDTFGLGVPYNGVSLPRAVPALLNALTHYAGYPSEWIEWSGTNDFYKVVSNAATAWHFGCAGLTGTLLGLGERTGSCPVEALVMEYGQLRGTLDGCDTTALAEVARFAKESLGLALPSHMPLLGERADLCHLDSEAERDALARHPQAFHGFDTERLLRRPLRPVVEARAPGGPSGAGPARDGEG